MVVISGVDGYDLECMAEDAVWGVAVSVASVVGAGDLLLLVITQIYCN